MFTFTDVCAYEIRRTEVDEGVGAHAQMGLPRLKLAQAMTRVMTTFLSARSQRLCCLDHCPRACIRTLPNSKSRTLKSGTLVSAWPTVVPIAPGALTMNRA